LAGKIEINKRRTILFILTKVVLNFIDFMKYKKTMNIIGKDPRANKSLPLPNLNSGKVINDTKATNNSILNLYFFWIKL
jgi:hypothetical protein